MTGARNEREGAAADPFGQDFRLLRRRNTVFVTGDHQRRHFDLRQRAARIGVVERANRCPGDEFRGLNDFSSRPFEKHRLGLGLTADRICVLLIDGLGAQALAAHPDVAPFLSSLGPTELAAGFPTTTPPSLSSLGVGVPPGEHGIVGYLINVPGYDRLVNSLRWRLHGEGPKIELLRELVPEQF